MPDILSPEQYDAYISAILQTYVPSEKGDPLWEEICRDFGGKGTTCGFLAHFVLYAIGYRGPILNRTVPDAGIKYMPGANISRIYNLGRAPFHRYSTGTAPQLGDIVFLSDGPPNSEHVLVFTEQVRRGSKVFWRSADGGQERNCMKMRERELVGRTLSGRGVMGWIAIRELRLTAEPIPYDEAKFQPCEFHLCGRDGDDDDAN